MHDLPASLLDNPIDRLLSLDQSAGVQGNQNRDENLPGTITIQALCEQLEVTLKMSCHRIQSTLVGQQTPMCAAHCRAYSGIGAPWRGACEHRPFSDRCRGIGSFSWLSAALRTVVMCSSASTRGLWRGTLTAACFKSGGPARRDDGPKCFASKP